MQYFEADLTDEPFNKKLYGFIDETGINIADTVIPALPSKHIEQLLDAKHPGIALQIACLLEMQHGFVDISKFEQDHLGADKRVPTAVMQGVRVISERLDLDIKFSN